VLSDKIAWVGCAVEVGNGRFVCFIFVNGFTFLRKRNCVTYLAFDVKCETTSLLRR
jgi:hypothetical protein